MGIEDCSWNAVDLLNIVDGAQLVTVVDDVYLCVWYGGGTLEIYDVTDPQVRSEMQSLQFRAPRTLLSAHAAIDQYFIALRADKLKKGLTTALGGGIVETESDDPTEVN